MNVNARFGFVLSLPATLLIVEAARAQTPITQRVSIETYGGQANAHSSGPAISADGRFVVFSTYASNLVAGDTNAASDVFLHDGQTGTTVMVSVATGGAHGNASSTDASLSADGRFVAFTSMSTNFIVGDTNATWDIFVRDLQNGTTERVSVATGGAQANSDSGYPALSDDGRFVAFNSAASNLVAGDLNTHRDVFVRDRVNGTTERASISSSGVEGNSATYGASITPDGRFVSFRSLATNLVAGDTNAADDTFLRDRQNGTTERISVSTGGAQGNSYSSQASISPDGRFLVFGSWASNLVAVDTNGRADIFMRDRQAATTERLNLGIGGAQANADSDLPVISADGRFVVFTSYASNLVAGDTNGLEDVFVRDLANATTERVSLSTSGTQANVAGGGTHVVAISADGRFVVYESASTNLVAGDTNGATDIFMRDRVGLPATYCTSSTSSNGCNATIAATANPSLSFAHACTISAANVDGQRSGLIFYGINNAGFESRPFATGSTSWLCVQPPTQRTPIQTSGGTSGACDGSFVLDWNAYQSSNPLALGNPWHVNAKVYVQAWFRDPLAVKTSNLSNVLDMTYVP